MDAALLDGRADLTVHSCKDLPMEENPDIPLAGFSRREDPRDVLVLPEGVTELDRTKPIGCASARRAVQLKAVSYTHLSRGYTGSLTTLSGDYTPGLWLIPVTVGVAIGQVLVLYLERMAVG